MANSAEKVVNEADVGIVENGKRELRSARMRLVQSTLLSNKPKIHEDIGDQDEKVCVGEEFCGSQGRKKRKSTTPQKRGPKKSKKNGAIKLTPKKIIHTEGTSPSVPDLRLEAKMIAEENSRMSAGRQIHPFFSLQKACKKSLEARWCTVTRKDNDCNPIHVFEKTGDDKLFFDWRNWTFLEGTIVNNGQILQSMCSSAVGGSVKSLRLDDLPIVLKPYDSEFVGNIDPINQGSIEQECIKKTSSSESSLVGDEQAMFHHLLSDTKLESNLDKSHGLSDSETKTNLDHPNRSLQNRMQSYYLGSQSHPKNCLWTRKYQPKMAMEVCGNLESVKFLSEWLRLWYGRNSKNKDSDRDDHCQKLDSNGNSSQSDSDYEVEDLDGEDSLKNVLLVTGFSGSGKSAAIYACAKEHNFKVFELSASDVRTGAVLKHLNKEVFVSHQLKWPISNSQELKNKLTQKLPSSSPEGTAAKDFLNEMIELIPLSDEDSKDSNKVVGEFEDMVAEKTCSQGEARPLTIDKDVKPLVLLEDVDITFLEDRGFISSIQEIAETGKGPIILTSNCSKPGLPVNLDRLHVSFTRPSSKELLRHLYMICASEGVNIQPNLLERLIELYHGDIRKIITYLQFWCQGTGFKDKIQKYSPLLFDLDAGHHILPMMMPWSLPSQLSEIVDEEITKSLLRMEKSSSPLEASEGTFYQEEMQNGLDCPNFEGSYFEAKKLAMLSRNGSVQDHNAFVQFDATHECSDTSGTPISLSKLKRCRRLSMVVSSESDDDEPVNKACSLIPDEDDNMLPSHCPESQNCSSPLNELLCFTENYMHEDHCPPSENPSDVQRDETCKSANVSCVPESSFVPETEFNEPDLSLNIMSHGHSCASPEVSVNELLQNALFVGANSFDSPTQTVKATSGGYESTYNVLNLSHPEGEGFSYHGHVKNIIGGYPLMDECSRVDFNKSKFAVKPKLTLSGDLVQESWKQLRLHHSDLRHHVTTEKQGTFQIIELFDKISHLISDSDLLLSFCQPQDLLDTSTSESEELDSFCQDGLQLQMASEIAEHGFCSFASNIATTGSQLGFESKLNIVSEMLASAANTTALGKLIRHDLRKNSASTKRILEPSAPRNNPVLERETKPLLFNAIQCLVPARSKLALKGDSFCEYLSSLRCISRAETSRLSKGPDNKTKRRRGRAPRHYLSTGSRFMSPEDITLLDQSNFLFKDIHRC